VTVRLQIALLVTLLTLATTTSCAKSVRRAPLVPGQPARVAELWQEPTSTRDLLYGPGGERLAPKARTFAFVAKDTSGWSPGFDVRDGNGLEWSVKLGAEAQSEVVTSRILWGLGYHQPPAYYLDNWTLTGAESGAQPAGRFRAELPNQKVVGEWSWYENPFVGSPEYGGLIVANVILNSWDWKTSNNKIYELAEADGGVQRWFVVRDVGASLGRTTYPTVLKWFRLRGFGQGTRNDLPGFESQGFITRIDNGRVEFDYRGIYRDVLNTVSPDDVRWICRRLAALTDRQWQDAFRAAGYPPEQATRYITKIRSKIDQGLRVTAG
jgi:hypothetical protein